MSDERLHVRPYPIYNEDSKRTLAALRLVNKAFCRSSTPHYFRWIQVTHPPKHPTELEPSPLLMRLGFLCKSPYASFVQHLKVGFENADGPDSPSHWSSNREYMQRLARFLLTSLLSRLSNLAVLEVKCAYYPLSPERGFAPDLARLFTHSLAQSLHNNPLPKLRELSLSFPVITEDGRFRDGFSSTAPITIEQVVRRLEHLEIFHSDDLNGDRRWVSSRPLLRFQPLSKIIEAAENLTSLHIGSANLLTLHNLDFSSLNRLHTLQIKGAAISCEDILSLMDICSEAMCRIRLNDVQLRSGTWEDVLLRISQLPSVQWFRLSWCGYARDGESSHLIPPLGPSVNHYIASTHTADYAALRDLKQKVNDNRSVVGLPELQDHLYS